MTSIIPKEINIYFDQQEEKHQCNDRWLEPKKESENEPTHRSNMQSSRSVCGDSFTQATQCLDPLTHCSFLVFERWHLLTRSTDCPSCDENQRSMLEQACSSPVPVNHIVCCHSNSENVQRHSHNFYETSPF